MISRLSMPTLKGLGDRWEEQIKSTFGRDAETFVPPSGDELVASRELVADVGRAVRQGQVEAVAERAAKLGFELVEIDTPRDRYVLLQESQPRGWGKVLYRVEPRHDLAIEVPHPCFDQGTPELGVELFERTGADTLLLAGAHRWNRSERLVEQPERGVADAAHSTQTFFHAAHQSLEGPVLQLHGFKARSPQEPEVFLSDGKDDQHDPAMLTGLRDQLEKAGFRPFIVDFAEDYLTARTNVQGQAMGERGEFIHVELSDAIRRGPGRAEAFDRVGQAVEGWLTPAAAAPPA